MNPEIRREALNPEEEANVKEEIEYAIPAEDNEVVYAEIVDDPEVAHAEIVEDSEVAEKVQQEFNDAMKAAEEQNISIWERINNLPDESPTVNFIVSEFSKTVLKMIIERSL